MDWGSVLGTIITVVVLPCIGILANYLVKYINTKIDQEQAKTTNEQTKQLLELADKVLTQCIQNTTETFVNTAKAAGTFTPEVAEKAFEMSKETFLKTISTDAEAAIKASYGDVDTWIKVAIESTIANLKKDSTTSTT